MKDKAIELLEENNRLLKATIIMKYVELNFSRMTANEKNNLVESAVILADTNGDILKIINKNSNVQIELDPER